MNKIKNIFNDGDSNKFLILLIALVIGLTLLVFSNYLKPNENKEDNITVTTQSLNNTDEITYSYGESYEKKLETRLEEALSYVEGAGKVKVMVKLSHSSEIVLSQDKNLSENTISEDDGEGGLRETKNYSEEVKNIIITEGGSQRPLVLKEIEPQIEGVIIVCEGGGVATIKDQLMRAVTTVLGIEINKVEVLKMK